MRTLAAPLALAALLAGCNSIELDAVSEPPPTLRGRIFADDKEIHLSPGVALAVQCVDTCDGPCRGPKVRSDDDAVVEVRKAYHLAGVARGESEEHNAATYVLLGLSPGRTEVRVESDCTDDTYVVKVIP